MIPTAFPFPKRQAALAMAASALLLAACASSPKPSEPVPLEATVPPLEQFMTSAAAARQEGARSTERDTYRKAAQAYPTSKLPWLRLAESNFDAGDYGNAIVAAQEALQRDGSDKLASSLLAVSGLRVAAGALGSMRQRHDALNTDTRTQAEDLVKSLREALGESVLVPKSNEPATAAAPVRRAVGQRPRVAAPAAPAATTAKPATPFDKLKP